MTLAHCFDAAVPPLVAPVGCTAVLGYIGREGYTPHVWTLEEWLRFTHLAQNPCWVPDLSAQPAAEADAMCDAARAMGWEPHRAGTLCAVVVDYETATGSKTAAWHAAMSARTTDRGFVAEAYGSLGTVLQIKAYDVWAADYDGWATIQGGPTVHATQYLANEPVAGGIVDLSVCDDWQMRHAGMGARRILAA